MRWEERALCAQIGPGLWTGGGGDRSSHARGVCQRCPVRVDCFKQGLSEPDIWEGIIWGGLTYKSLRRAKRHYRDGMAPEAILEALG